MGRGWQRTATPASRTGGRSCQATDRGDAEEWRVGVGTIGSCAKAAHFVRRAHLYAGWRLPPLAE